MDERALHRQYFLLVLAAAALVATITALSGIGRLHTFQTFMIDHGVFHLFLREVSQGLPPLSSINIPYEPVHWLGFHFSPILYLFAPLYMVWPDASVLFIVQSLLMACAPPILFLTGRDMGLSPRISAAFALLALFNVYFLSGMLSDFHEVAFAVPLMCIGLRALINRRMGWLLFACLGLVLTKEHYGVAVAGFGLLWGYHHKDWKNGLLLTVCGLLAAVLVLKGIMPALNHGVHPMAQGETDGGLNRYGWIAPRLATFEMFFLLLTYGGFCGSVYLMLLMGGFGYLPLLVLPFLLPGAADLAANLLSANETPRQPIFYHSAPLIPVFAVAAMQAWRSVPRLDVRYRKLLLGIALVTCALFLPWRVSSMLPSVFPPVLVQQDKERLQRVAGLFSRCEYPSVQSSFAANLPLTAASRPFLASVAAKADCVALRLGPPAEEIDIESAVFTPYTPLLPLEYTETVRNVLKDPEWHIAYWDSPWLFLTREQGLPLEEEVLARQEAFLRLKGLIARFEAARAEQKAKKVKKNR